VKLGDWVIILICAVILLAAAAAVAWSVDPTAGC
jgi:hypothetical protein